MNEEEKNNFCQWLIIDNNTYSPTSNTIKEFKAGFYSINTDYRGNIFFKKENLKEDNLMTFPNSQFEKISNEIITFWNNEKIFKENNFLHKRGLLLWGSQGCGKTSIIKNMVKFVISKNGVCFTCTDSVKELIHGIKIFREIEPDRKIMIILEDIDSIISMYGDKELLSLLDGNDSIDNVLIIATTNYPEKLDGRIINRPRRFDKIIEIILPTEKIRREFFKSKLDWTTEEIEDIVNKTKDFSFASLVDIVISITCFNKSLKEAAETLNRQLKSKPSSTTLATTVGFNNKE